MSDTGIPTRSPSELKLRIEAENAGLPFLIFRDEDGAQVILALTNSPSAKLVVGRGESADMNLGFDPEISRLHAELERIGGAWVISDDGFSRNGSFVNGERVAGRRRLRDGDEIRFGATVVLYRDPTDQSGGGETIAASSRVETEAIPLPEAPRRVLIALCRPYRAGEEFTTPASNREIAEELFISVETVKSHLRSLFEVFGLADEPQNVKRRRLVERAIRTGTVTRRDLSR